MSKLTGLAEKLKRAGHILTAPRQALVRVLEQEAAIVLLCTTFFILAFLFAPGKGALWAYLSNRGA